MAVFAAMIDCMDQNIGRVIQKLDEMNVLDNTLIMYLSDNGSCPYDSNRNLEIPPGGPDSYRSLCAAWANVGNTPFRFYKQYGHEGGCRTHFIAHWPQVISPGRCESPEDAAEGLRNIQLCLAHAIYLEATLKQVCDGVGSRGSALTLSADGQACHESLGNEWNFQPENTEFRNKVLETYMTGDGQVKNNWVPCRELPHCDGWFETVWAEFNKNEIYNN